MADATEDRKKVRALTHVFVEGLFGRYTYAVPADGILDPQLSILYGENGAGKTTILRILHEAISSALQRGHKTALLEIPFQRFVATFAGGIELCIERPDASDGSYDMSLDINGRIIARATFEAIDGKIPKSSPLSHGQDELTQIIGSTLQLNSYFLADERRLHSDIFNDDDDDLSAISTAAEADRLYRLALHRRTSHFDDRNSQLSLALNRALQWARPQALTGANVGSVNANTIYADVVKRLSVEPEIQRSSKQDDRTDEMVSVIEGLAARAANQARFGLTSSIDTSELIAALKHAGQDRRSIIIELLKPYVDGIRARLDAMEELYSILKAFVESLNSFLLDKQATFDVREGLVVRTKEGARLAPERLSSGEKQLLMLLCNLLISRQHPSLFLVDEPELSLNIKWQRKLIPALLSVTAGSQIQLLLATHSIELISSSRERVVRLPFGGE